MEQKIAKRIERVFKGVSHSKRARILEYVAEENNTSLWEISQGLDIEFRNASHHTEIMEKAGLIEKKYVGKSVMHFLTPYGQRVYDFMKSLK